MKNFVINFLEWNKERVFDIKSMMFQGELFGNEWAFRNLGIVVLIVNILIAALLLLVSLVLLPIGIILIIINVLYIIYKTIINSTYFNNSYIKKSLKEYENSLNEKNTYYLTSITGSQKFDCIVLESNIDEFLIKFFNNFNNTYRTHETNTNKYICGISRRRSIGDLYLICKNYFPDTNLDDVIISLIKLVNSDKLGISKCSDIKKYVFVKKNDYTGNYQDKNLEFIHGINFKQLITYYERNGRLS